MREASITPSYETLPQLVSTGGQNLREHALFATPAVAEKGHLSVRIDVTTPGGHSSVPPPHTVRQDGLCPILTLTFAFSGNWYLGISDYQAGGQTTRGHAPP